MPTGGDSPKDADLPSTYSIEYVSKFQFAQRDQQRCRQHDVAHTCVEVNHLNCQFLW